MKRTTIMVEEDLLYDLQLLAKQRERSTASLIREALAVYVVDERSRAPEQPALMAIVGLGASDAVIDLAQGEDERQLREDVDPLTGWGVDP